MTQDMVTMQQVKLRNPNKSVTISKLALCYAGFWPPQNLEPWQRTCYYCYSLVSFTFLLGMIIFIQFVDMYQIWGNIPAMTGNAFVLFTNLAQTVKLANFLWRYSDLEDLVQETSAALTSYQDIEGIKIVKRCNKETLRDQSFYFFLTTLTITGWALGTKGKTLPLRAWYPFNTQRSPNYELTFLHQITAIFLAAWLNVAKDTLTTTLIAQTRCRLQLVRLSLRTLTDDLVAEQDRYNPTEIELLTSQREEIAIRRLRMCVIRHEDALEAARRLEVYFSKPTFAQFSVSMVIICVSAFQLAMQTGANVVKLMSMGTYLINMVFQVFIYCWHGDQLTIESGELLVDAWSCAWYRCSGRFARALIVLGARCARPSQLTAAGFAALSLHTFVALIKTSYSFFTVLQQVSDQRR